MHLIIEEGVILGCPEVQEMNRCYQKLSQGKRFGVLVSAKDFSSISEKAREMSASEEYSENKVAVAAIVDNIGHSLMAAIYMKMNKPVSNVKVFKEREKAVNWLRGELEENLEQ